MGSTNAKRSRSASASRPACGRRSLPGDTEQSHRSGAECRCGRLVVILEVEGEDASEVIAELKVLLEKEVIE